MRLVTRFIAGVLVVLFAVACGSEEGEAEVAVASEAETAQPAAPHAADGTPEAAADASATEAPTAAPTEVATPAPPPPPPGPQDGMSFLSQCELPGGQRYYALFWRAIDEGFVRGGQVDLSLRTRNGTELRHMPVHLQQHGDIVQGYVMTQRWTTQQVGGELNHVVVSVSQAPAPAQLHDVAELNPVDIELAEVTFTTAGPVVSIRTENQGEINANFQVDGFVVNEAGELVAAFRGNGQIQAGSTPTVARTQNTFACAGMSPSPVTVYASIRIIQRVGNQNFDRSELATFEAS